MRPSGSRTLDPDAPSAAAAASSSGSGSGSPIGTPPGKELLECGFSYPQTEGATEGPGIDGDANDGRTMKELALDEKENFTPYDNEELTTKDIEERPIAQVSLSPGNEVTLTPQPPGGQRHIRSEQQPALRKKDFQKMPKWDFEDVYTSNDHSRQTACPLSLRTSEDANFTESFLPNINLFMYNSSVNMSEWNRLSHFNNPFGFMEYDYKDVKGAVENIPKPQQPLLVSRGGGCVTCAVVGMAGILNGSGMGQEIDRHDYVFRMNGAVTQGYEDDVGNKTSIYLHTAHSLTAALIYNKKHGFKRIPQDEGIKYVMIPEGIRDLQWLQALFTGKLVAAGPYKNLRPSQYYSGDLNNQFYLLHPDFMRYVRNRFLKSPGLDYDFWPVVRPSNGALALFLALHTCDVVNAYGFITEDYHKYPYNYCEGHGQRKMNFYLTHDFVTEMKAWKKLHNAGIIKLYQRMDN
ncbi:hypothetical protein NHX12_025575 [Muraenolepis orangiensis]|uniref:alpha-N-acetylgalactosaminide alpha-2,6-sialyltransferase n=1 Tax=Muraenolepis orangiensis TaxID=630683 RepID=A0A9Q0ELG1_9TELE|nr:hypothetical protein NHX12_025575 [Muraenolepis orangiensis]